MKVIGTEIEEDESSMQSVYWGRNIYITRPGENIGKKRFMVNFSQSWIYRCKRKWLKYVDEVKVIKECKEYKYFGSDYIEIYVHTYI